MGRREGRPAKVRLWGPPKGGMETWRGASIVPAAVSNSFLLHLHGLHEAGRIGSYRFERLGAFGAGGAAVWMGRLPKDKRPPCRARTRKGDPCRARAVDGRERCRLHGGLSTGAKTPEGRARIVESNRRRAALRRQEREAIPANLEHLER